MQDHLLGTIYTLIVYTENGLVYSIEFDGIAPIELTLPVKQHLFYRCEVTSESDGLPVVSSNPIRLDSVPSTTIS